MKKFFHFFGFHSWGKWEEYTADIFMFGQRIEDVKKQKRTCSVCGYIEKDSL